MYTQLPAGFCARSDPFAVSPNMAGLNPTRLDNHPRGLHVHPSSSSKSSSSAISRYLPSNSTRNTPSLFSPSYFIRVRWRRRESQETRGDSKHQREHRVESSGRPITRAGASPRVRETGSARRRQEVRLQKARGGARARARFAEREFAILPSNAT